MKNIRFSHVMMKDMSIFSSSIFLEEKFLLSWSFQRNLVTNRPTMVDNISVPNIISRSVGGYHVVRRSLIKTATILEYIIKESYLFEDSHTSSGSTLRTVFKIKNQWSVETVPLWQFQIMPTNAHFRL